jgi:hypothetical protein
MTKDRLSDFNLNTDDTPQLRPNKRQTSINKWRSPSFVESYHTLLSSRGNRQILLFALGFLCPFFWLLGALLPLPPRRTRDANEAEKALPTAESEDDLTSALNKHRSGDAKIKWDEEKIYLKAKWWRTLNRVMCFVGVAIIAAVVSQPANLDSIIESLLISSADRPCCHRDSLIVHTQTRSLGTRIITTPTIGHSLKASASQHTRPTISCQLFFSSNNNLSRRFGQASHEMHRRIPFFKLYFSLLTIPTSLVLFSTRRYPNLLLSFCIYL